MREKWRLLPIGLVGAVLLPACTFHHSVPIRYTPLIQTKRLADPGNPQVIVIGEFKDTRATQRIGREPLNPISVHKVEFKTVGDVPTIVRSAFLDGFLKSGFNVPAEGETAPDPLLNVTGKVVTYTVDSKSGWSKVTVTADVAVEVTLTDKNGTATPVTCNGKGLAEGESLGYDATYADTLDRALQECVKNFLKEEKFLAVLKAPPAPAESPRP